MASVPQNSTRSQSDSSGVSHLKAVKAGLTALKQGNVKAAIAQLEPLVATLPPSDALFQAQIGLAVAYDKVGQRDRSIALCRELSQSSNPKAQQWAIQKLDRWGVLPEANTQPTGFVPFSEEDLSNPPSTSTGFVPFSEEDAQNLSASVPQATGFVPFEDQPREIQHVRQPPQNRESVLDGVPTPSEDRPILENEEIASLDEPPVDANTTEVPSPPKSWRNADRADRPQPLKGSRLGQLRLLQLGTILALFALLLGTVGVFTHIYNEILNLSPISLPISGFYGNLTRFVAIVLVLFAIAAPWLLDALLRFAYGWKPLSLKTLSHSSPEAAQLLRQVCRQKKISLPTLGILPDTAPVIFTYGHLPATARIAVSRGLLDRLEDDEIAALYAAELAHILYGDAAVMSLGLILMQIPYTLYWKSARFGDRLHEEAQNRQGNAYQFYSLTIATWTFAVVSAIAYGFYWLLRLPLLPLSRQRLTESDRFAAATTGNPNGFARTLLKLAIGIAEDIQQQEQTSYLLESFEGVMPVSHRQALSIGSAYPHLATESLFSWDLGNPQRHWLTLNNTHPLLGERLAWLTRCARFWKLQPEFDLETASPPRRPEPARLWLQGAPFFGWGVGLCLGIALTLAGWVGQELNWRQFSWIFSDRAWLIPGLMLAGFSIGTLIRINPFFGDLKPSALSVEPNLLERFSQPRSLPLDSYPVRVSGKLLGRRGIANWLGQDLIVQTETLSVTLHHSSKFGFLGNFLPQGIRPSDWVGGEATVTGWWRRGATVWIDADTFKRDRTQTPANGHPIGSTLLVALTAVGSAYLIAGGGL